MPAKPSWKRRALPPLPGAPPDSPAFNQSERSDDSSASAWVGGVILLVILYTGSMNMPKYGILCIPCPVTMDDDRLVGAFLINSDHLLLTVRRSWDKHIVYFFQSHGWIGTFQVFQWRN